MAFAGVLRQAWIPPVVPAVIDGAGFSVPRLRAASGKSEVANIGYFDVNSDPRRLDGARLPWSIQIAANSPAVLGDVVAQDDSDSIGCRIVVDGEVKAERISNEVNAFTYCRVEGA
jgi:hypothetical protein